MQRKQGVADPEIVFSLDPEGSSLKKSLGDKHLQTFHHPSLSLQCLFKKKKKKLETIHFGVHSWGVVDNFFTRLGWEYRQDM